MRIMKRMKKTKKIKNVEKIPIKKIILVQITNLLQAMRKKVENPITKAPTNKRR